jgi:iron complex transport system substrate-binding protein
MRIVSMLSSATEMIHALGLERHLVAISHECDWPPEALRLPRASRVRFDPAEMTSGEIDAAVRRCMREHGSVYAVDVDLLRDLEPDLVLTQGICEVCAVPTGSVLEAVRTLPRPARVLALDAHTLADIFSGMRSVGAAADEADGADRVVRRLLERLARVRAVVADSAPPRVLALEWLDPPFAPGHWVPEMIRAAGGAPVCGEAAAPSRELAWDEVSALEPDVLVLLPCGYSLPQARADADQTRDLLERAAPEPLAAGRSWLMSSAHVSRSGPRVVDGVEALARAFHPRLFAAPPDPAILPRWP